MKKKIYNNIKQNIELILVFILFLFFILILRDVYKSEITTYDVYFKELLVDNLRSGSITNIMKLITFLGSGYFLVASTIILFIVLKDKKYAILSSVNLIIITLLNIIIKLIIRRPRPLDINIIIEKGFSFPSGHSMVSCAYYGLIMYIIHKTVDSKKTRYILYIVLSALIIAICISRIYLGVHYASDILAGLLISIMYLLTFIVIIPKYIRKRK